MRGPGCATAGEGVEVVHLPEPARCRREHERAISLGKRGGLFGHGRADGRLERARVGVRSTPEAVAGEHLAVDAHVGHRERQDRLTRHAQRRLAGRGAASGRLDRVEAAPVHEGRADAQVIGGRARRNDRRVTGRAEALARHVHREHREPEDRRLADLLLVELAHVRADDREVRLLSLNERLTNRHARAGSAGAQLRRDLEVEALAVQDHRKHVARLGAGAELVAGGRDERAHPLAGGRLRPVRSLRDQRLPIRVHQVVREVAALTEHDRVRKVLRRVRQRVGAKHRRLVGGERRGVIRMRSDEADVMPFVEPGAGERVRGPGLVGEARRGGSVVDEVVRRRRAVRRDRHGLLCRQRGSHPEVELVTDRVRTVSHEVVAGGQRSRVGRQDAPGERAQHPGHLARGLDEPPDRQIRDREQVIATIDAQLRAVRVLSHEVPESKYGLRGAGVEQRREELLFVSERAAVRVAEERDDRVRTDEEDVLRRRRPRAIDDPIDLGRHEVLRIRASERTIGLLVREGDARVGTDVDDLSVHRGQRRERQQRGLEVSLLLRGPNQARAVDRDDRERVRLCTEDRRATGGDRRLLHARARARKQCHGKLERIVQAEGAVPAAHADIEVARLVPGVAEDELVGHSRLQRPGQERSLLRAHVRLR